ncbi:MAG: hypothetical protein WBY44_09045 [Bryobacteraceae bacterium]
MAIDEDRLDSNEERAVPDGPTEPVPEPEAEVRPRRSSRLILAALIIALAILGNAWMVTHPRAVSFNQTYQAVLLSNNNVYFGKLQGYGTDNPVLTEVYYVQTVVDPETKQQTNVLTKRGKEWHSPDRMYINPKQIMIVEPVGPNSRVAELIKELKLQR